MMNELQLSLMGLGLLAIVLVLVYNRWVEHKHRKQHAPAPEVVVTEFAEEISATDRQEPVWEQGGEPVDTVHNGIPESPEISDVFTAPEPIAALTEVESWVDAIATLRFYETRTAGSIRDTLNQMGIARFERVEFYSGDGWHRADVLANDAQVTNLRARLQLASRRGPVQPDALHEWMRSIESLAQMLSAGLSVESESALMDRAANLDAFCVRVDALISLNLKPVQDATETFNQLHTVASTLGLTGEFPNFARLSGQGDVDFQVQADPSTSLISLVLDFPHVNRPDAVVTEMLDLAKSLSSTLTADIVDDAGRPMNEEGMALLVNQVVRLNATLQAQGIEPGSPLAHRLFS